MLVMSEGNNSSTNESFPPIPYSQRNERRGWMGDAALTVNEALYNFDLIKFYFNFLNLIRDAQLIDGQVYIHREYQITDLAHLFFKYGDWVPLPPYEQTNRH